ncbi:hypothetical protein A2U01_0066721 [Trifolium medium]|uniref:Uncharacterized protein n=1 Tax=Trifolium medium TaxID=97028 RepID=A0A392SAI8_9FABA|nr:hypothetical protein [Trifolium medium]
MKLQLEMKSLMTLGVSLLVDPSALKMPLDALGLVRFSRLCPSDPA